jgi:protoporphyrinogen oxidase
MTVDQHQPVVIVGAGVSGLSLGLLLAQKGIPTVVLEKEDDPGGLARSFHYDGFTFDIGPHRFHTDVDEVDRFIRLVLDQSARSIGRESWVRFAGQFYPWPLHPSKSMLRIPPGVALGAAVDLFSLYHKKPALSFRDHIINMYGETLYRHFFEGYSSKFLGIVPELTHPDWAQTGIDRAIIDKRLKMNNLFQLLSGMLTVRRAPETRFLYPAGGCQQFIGNLVSRFEALGGQLYCGKAVTSMALDKDGVRVIRAGRRSFKPSLVVWTGTLHSLAKVAGLPEPDLEYLSLVCFNMELNEGNRFPFQWCYHGASDVLFSRVSIPENFDPGNTPQGRRAMCVEVTCREGDDLYTHPEKQLDRVIFDMKRESLLRADSEFIDVHYERIPWAYPIYKFNYREKMGEVQSAVDDIGNLMLAGRLGRFWYNNMDHCIEASLELAADITHRLNRS